jgi:hypothetical protein
MTAPIVNISKIVPKENWRTRAHQAFVLFASVIAPFRIWSFISVAIVIVAQLLHLPFSWPIVLVAAFALGAMVIGIGVYNWWAFKKKRAAFEHRAARIHREAQELECLEQALKAIEKFDQRRSRAIPWVPPRAEPTPQPERGGFLQRCLLLLGTLGSFIVRCISVIGTAFSGTFGMIATLVAVLGCCGIVLTYSPVSIPLIAIGAAAALICLIAELYFSAAFEKQEQAQAKDKTHARRELVLRDLQIKIQGLRLDPRVTPEDRDALFVEIQNLLHVSELSQETCNLIRNVMGAPIDGQLFAAQQEAGGDIPTGPVLWVRSWAPLDRGVPPVVGERITERGSPQPLYEPRGLNHAP